MKKLICDFLGHKWIITAHVSPLVISTLLPGDEEHPIANVRVVDCGQFERRYRSRRSHPLAGCKAYCDRCNQAWDDTWPESEKKGTITRLIPPVKLLW